MAEKDCRMIQKERTRPDVKWKTYIIKKDGNKIIRRHVGVQNILESEESKFQRRRKIDREYEMFDFHTLSIPEVTNIIEAYRTHLSYITCCQAIHM